MPPRRFLIESALQAASNVLSTMQDVRRLRMQFALERAKLEKQERQRMDDVAWRRRLFEYKLNRDRIEDQQAIQEAEVEAQNLAAKVQRERNEKLRGDVLDLAKTHDFDDGIAAGVMNGTATFGDLMKTATRKPSGRVGGQTRADRDFQNWKGVLQQTNDIIEGSLPEELNKTIAEIPAQPGQPLKPGVKRPVNANELRVHAIQKMVDAAERQAKERQRQDRNQLTVQQQTNIKALIDAGFSREEARATVLGRSE